MLHLIAERARPSCCCIRSGFAIGNRMLGARSVQGHARRASARYTDAQIIGPAELRQPIDAGFAPWR